MKLNPDNCMAWAHSMEVILDAKELWRNFGSTEPIPDIRTRPKDNKVRWVDNKQVRM